MRLSPNVDTFGKDERYKWCLENCQLGSWYLDRNTFVFIKRYDALMFKLQWGESQIEEEE